MSQSTAEVKYKLQHRNINNGKRFTCILGLTPGSQRRTKNDNGGLYIYGCSISLVE